MINLCAGEHYINDITDPHIRGEGSAITTLYTNGIVLDDSKRDLDIRGVRIISNYEGVGVGLYSNARGKAIIHDVQICGFQDQMVMDHTGVGTSRDDQKNHWFHSYRDLYLYESTRGMEFSNELHTTGLTLKYSGEKDPLSGFKFPFNFFNTVGFNKGYVKAKHPVLIDGPTSTVFNDVYMENNRENICLEITDRSSGVTLLGCNLENKNRAPLIKIGDPRFCRLMAYGHSTSGTAYSGRIIRGNNSIVGRTDSDYKYLRVHTENYDF